MAELVRVELVERGGLGVWYDVLGRMMVVRGMAGEVHSGRLVEVRVSRSSGLGMVIVWYETSVVLLKRVIRVSTKVGAFVTVS